MTARQGDSWVILLLEDLREVAQRENLPASAEAIADAIEVVRNEMYRDEDAPNGDSTKSGPSSKPRH